MQNDSLSSLRRPTLADLFALARKRLESGHASLSVEIASPEAHRELVGLLGPLPRFRVGATARVRMSELDAAVRARTGMALGDVLVELHGRPLRDRRAEAATAAGARAALLATAEATELTSHAWYRAWVGELRATSNGTLTRLLGRPDRLARAVRVLELLDGNATTLPELADKATGDAHALDSGRPLSGLVLAALAFRAGSAAPDSAEDRRDLWERFGVAENAYSSTVLVLNLPARGEALGEWMTSGARHGTALRVTLDQLVRHPVSPDATVVHVCENPSVLGGAARELGPACPPLVCAEGQPSVAFLELAERIALCGGSLRYHGDFDWPGIRMTAALVSRHGAAPWRMSSTDYLQGLADAERSVSRPPLKGGAQETPWDPELQEVMRARGVALSEESVIPSLLSDLRAHAANSVGGHGRAARGEAGPRVFEGGVRSGAGPGRSR
ncbi:uncharacterized protein (TIGR02679 family) [Actinocorallia herbida]|uniref:Uncharacterized protein (TIGR02679 family) n=1 Tax=Actinocorallia herbida TaxID=58109 RepID=A0A3N1CP13_9ACTN|nr:TIGR02679 family protein [Actinocorallia herbida]ROO83032.1 uncharacterized protein (TIGR02679 family) [Actinocorallia herbida]